MTLKTEERTLSTQTEESGELVPTSGAAEKQYEIQSAIVMAKKMPRNEDQAFEQLMKSCLRPSFAENCAYSFPRGGVPVRGPSVHLAREGARTWGNIRYGLDILRDDEESRLIRGWAWDLQTNMKVSAEDEFKKLIYRKNKGWIKPDERDLRELTNRRGAILQRNCILQLLPKDLVEDAMNQAKLTIQNAASKDPDAAKKNLIVSFSQLNITPEMLSEKLGHPLDQSSPTEIAELRLVYKSISDGNSTWAEYVNGHKEKESNKGSLSMSDLQPGSDKMEAEEEQPSAVQEPPVEAPTNEEPPESKDPPKKGRVISKAKLVELLTQAETAGWKPTERDSLIGEFGYQGPAEVREGDFGAIMTHLRDGTLPTNKEER